MRALRVRAALARLSLSVIGLLAVAAVWSALAAGDHSGTRFPDIGTIWQAIKDNFHKSDALAYAAYGTGGIWSNLLWTAKNVYLAVAIGLAVGFLLGTVLARVRWLEKLAELPMTVLGTIPVLVLLPFLSVWFGTSLLATSGLVIFYTALTVMAAVQEATHRAIDYYGDYAASLGMGGHRLVLMIMPAVFPETIGVLRAAAGLGWGFECVAELLGGRSGVGRLISTFGQEINSAGVIGTVVCIALAAIVTDAVLVLVARWLIRWSE